MVKLLSVILVKTFEILRFPKYLSAHMKSAQKLDPFTLHIRAKCAMVLGNVPGCAHVG
jgi:hypothetical protein